MPWFAVYESTTGRLVSVGQQVADPLPAGLTAAQLGQRPADNQMWDTATRAFVARPAKVLVDRLLTDLLSNPAFSELQTAYNSLSAANKTRIRNGLILFLGRLRWRAQGEAVTLDG
jgi:hypothetical protein